MGRRLGDEGAGPTGSGLRHRYRPSNRRAHSTQATSCRTLAWMPFCLNEKRLSLSRILPGQKGIRVLRPAPVNYFRGGSRLRTSQSSAFRQNAALTFSCADTRKSAHPSVGAPVVSPNLAAAADHQLVEYPAGVDHPGVRVHGCACTVGMAGRRRKEKLMFIQTVASKPRRWPYPRQG